MTTEEIWKNITDSNGKYQISTHGRVKSFAKNKNGDLMKGYIDRDKYISVGIILNNNSKSKRKRIHQLVADHFISNPHNYKIVDHIDNNRQNNNLENLRWVNRRHNSLNASIRNTNTTGVKGVFYHKERKQWGATYYTEQGKSTYKLFKTKEEAIEYRRKMVKLHYPDEYYKHDDKKPNNNTNNDNNDRNEIWYEIENSNGEYYISNYGRITNFDDEEWKDINGYNGDYKISNYCRIKSFKQSKTDGKFIKPNKHGVITLLLENKPKYFFQHRLCADHFISNPDNLPIVDHIDGNIFNNHVDNLRWVSHQQNTLNSKIAKHNTSGYKGVSYQKPDKLWVASWYEKIGKRKTKSFKSKEDAIEHRKKMVGKYYQSNFYIEDR